MQLSLTSAILAALPLASAHFTVQHPYWRGDSFADDTSQWVWPCANVSQVNSTNNRTSWSINDGGSFAMTSSHEWSPLYVNIGLGNEPANFNISLLSHFNLTGNGTFCIPQLGRDILKDMGLKSGDNATIQIIQTTTSGSSLYNCADITFTDEAELLPEDQCKNATGVGGETLGNVDAATQTEDEDATSTGSAAENTSSDAAIALGQPVGMGVLVGGVVAALGVLGL